MKLDKYNISLIILCIVFSSINTANIKGTVTVSSANQQTPAVRYAKEWADLLVNVNPSTIGCKPAKPEKKKPEDFEFTVSGSIPKKKINKWNLQQGFGHASYLFDYLDDVFQKDVVKEFKSIFDEAFAINPLVEYKDPYTLDQLAFYYSQGLNSTLSINVQGNQEATSFQEKQFAMIKKNFPDFDKYVYLNSITVPKLKTILIDWGWSDSQGALNVQNVMDAFDFNGDGRLNPSELILLSIIYNDKSVKSGWCKKHCYDTIYSKLIDPLFAYIDCDNDGVISAENIWIALTNLKRKDATLYNMYNCAANGDKVSKSVRSNSCNDFMLKNKQTKVGLMDLSGFRRAVLLGYWDRQTNTAVIVEDDSKNSKSLRWGNNGAVDINCQVIHSFKGNLDPSLLPAVDTVKNDVTKPLVV